MPEPSAAKIEPGSTGPSPLRAIRLGLELRGVGRMLALALLVGVVAGLGAIVFNLACAAASRIFLDGIAGYRPEAPSGEHEYFAPGSGSLSILWLPVVAAVGGLLSALIVRRFAPDAAGHGTDSAIDAYHNREGRVPLRTALVKIVASALTIGSGGSGGREGPIAQIGAGFGSYFSDLFRLSARERRILLAAGMGAGVGSIFHAPLAGALFAGEILYSDAEFESDALIPAAVATIVAYCVFCLHSGFGSLFATPDVAFESLWEVVPYTVLAVVVTLAAALFVWVFYYSHDRWSRARVPAILRPMLGGLVTGSIGVGLYFAAGEDFHVLDVLSFGYGTLQDAMEGSIAVPVLLMLAVGKMLTTAMSIGSGGSGGVFGPSMVIGGCVGGVVGLVGHGLAPEIVVHPGAYVLVGMAGFFAAAGKVPISTIVMVSEMTGNYTLLMPALWVSSLSFVLSGPVQLYRSQARSRLESAAHKHELVVDVLAGMRVADLEHDHEFEVVRENTTLDAIVRLFSRTTQHYYPVVDADGRMVGILSANDVRLFVDDRAAGAVVIATDIMQTDVVTLREDQDLEVALQRFVSLDVDALPIVDDEDANRVVGMLSRRDLILAYNAARSAWRDRT